MKWEIAVDNSEFIYGKTTTGTDSQKKWRAWNAKVYEDELR